MISRASLAIRILGLKARLNIQEAQSTYLHKTQILQTILNQLLYPALLRFLLMLTERISCLSTRIFAEVVVGELG